MTSAEILSLISTISFVIAAISFGTAVFLWFYFKIPAVIGDLSGRTAKKSIARIRTSNERSGGQGYRPSAANVDRGKLTDTMQHAQKLNEEGGHNVPADKKNAAEAQISETELLPDAETKEQQGCPTELLDGNEPPSMLGEENETVSLTDETSLLIRRPGGKKFTMLEDIVLIHTDEVIF